MAQTLHFRPAITSDEDFDAAHCVSPLQHSLKKKSVAVLESIESYETSSEQKLRIGVIRDHLRSIETLIERVDVCIDTMVQEYEDYISLLCTIPGINHNRAIMFISEIGADMAQLGSSNRLCTWAVLALCSNQSDGKKKSVNISRTGVYLKPALVQVVHTAVKDRRSPYYSFKYKRITKCRSKKRDVIAVARCSLTAVSRMFSTGKIWDLSNLYKVDMPEHPKQRDRAQCCYLSCCKEACQPLRSLGKLTAKLHN